MRDTQREMDEEEFEQHRKEIHGFISEKSDEMGEKQLVRVLGYELSELISMYRVHQGGGASLMHKAQDGAKFMREFAEMSLGMREPPEWYDEDDDE